MANTFQATKVNLKQLLSTAPLEVPQFQRSYSWQKEQVDDLWSDIRSNLLDALDEKSQDIEYFLGSVVTMPETIRKGALLDGQQRLATLTILLSLIRDRLVKQKDDERARKLATYIQEGLIELPIHASTKYRVTFNREDRSFFQQLVQAATPEQAVPTLDSHQRIQKARRNLSRSLNEYIGENKEAVVDRLADLLTRIETNIVFVDISVDSAQEAAIIFECLNDRGLSLTVADLLRNLLFIHTNEAEHEELRDKWEKLLSYFRNDNLVGFLRYAWMSREGEVRKTRTYDEIERVIRQKPPRETPLGYLTKLLEDAKSYSKIADASASNADLSRALLEFNALNARQCIPLLIALTQRHQGIAAKSISFINTFTFRYSSICGRNPNRLERTYSDLARYARIHEDSQIVRAEIEEALRGLDPGDERFIADFENAELGRTDVQRYALTRLEMAAGDHGELQIAGPNAVHVEHIYPRRPRERWSDHDAWVNRLGNLTLLLKGLNEEASNKGFEEKKPLFAESQLKITKELADLPDWSRAAIEERQRRLSELAKVAWRL